MFSRQWLRARSAGAAATLRRFARNRDGVALIDFALVSPIILLVLAGGFEIGQYVLLNQKLNAVAARSADLVSRAEEAVEGDIRQIFAASQYEIAPFQLGDKGVIVISSVATEGINPPEVMWQMSGGGTATAVSRVGTVGQRATLPAGFNLENNRDVIVAEIFYDYQPFVFSGIMDPKRIYHTAIFRPRLAALKTLTPSPP